MSAFSLVEMLVVITIVSLLVALLLPSLRDARDLALVTQCSARQRQVGIALADYATVWKTFPTPYGQPGFDGTIMDPNLAMSRYVAGWNYSGTWNEVYQQSVGAWWVGAVTQDEYWYLNKGFQCTATHPFPQTPWAAFQGRDQPSYFTTGGMLCSTIRGVTYSDPNTKRGYLSPWFMYVNPFANSIYFADWWDACNAGNDFANNLFAGTDNTRYQMAPVNYIVGPRYEQLSTRPQLTCPVVSNFTNGASRTIFEPHGRQDWTGYQNSRAPKDPEAKNYLYTDGSVKYIKH